MSSISSAFERKQVANLIARTVQGLDFLLVFQARREFLPWADWLTGAYFPPDFPKKWMTSLARRLFAQEQNSQVLCYANANFTRRTQAGALWEFVEFWHGLSGRYPQWLYFDSKLAPYYELSRLTEKKIWFVTIRRRGSVSAHHAQGYLSVDGAWKRSHD